MYGLSVFDEKILSLYKIGERTNIQDGDNHSLV